LITGAAETDIVVRIASRPIQVERKRSCIVRVIPIATAQEHVIVSPFSYNTKTITVYASCPTFCLNSSNH
jgi:hypothetical protein